jgi:CheY-like chemotaxis protein
LNLIVNARDAMSGRGTLVISTDFPRLSGNEPELSAAQLPAGQYLAVRVKDDGPGMSREIAARAFEPFFTTKESGSGIGLPMVHGFARQSGGTAHIDTAPGRGTCITLYLPMETGSAAALPAPAPPDPATAVGRVLVVDDEPDLAAGMSDLLASNGYAVRQVRSGIEALSVLERDRFDVLLTDIAMRGMTGIELAEATARMQPDLAILLITGNPDSAREVTRWPVLDKAAITATLPAVIRRTIADQVQARARARAH